MCRALLLPLSLPPVHCWSGNDMLFPVQASDCRSSDLIPVILCRHRALFASSSRGALAAALGAGAGAGGAAAGAFGEAAAAGGGVGGARRPAEPVQLLTFDNLVCSVPTWQERSWRAPWARQQGPPAGAAGQDGAAAGQKHILKGVSGVAACGELVGVLGPSGKRVC